MKARPPEAAPTGPTDGGRITPRVGPRRPRGPQDSLNCLAAWVSYRLMGQVWGPLMFRCFSCGPWVWAFYACVVFSRGPTDKRGLSWGLAPGRLNCHMMLLAFLARRPTVLWPPVGMPEGLKPSGRGPRGPEVFIILFFRKNSMLLMLSEKGPRGYGPLHGPKCFIVLLTIMLYRSIALSL